MAPSPLDGLSVFLVEDEALVAMLVEDMLSDHGCTVVATAARLEEALSRARDRSLHIDIAILDLNLAGDSTFPVAQVLEERGVPFAFATGYGAGGLPPEWKSRPTLQKPFTAADIARVLVEALARV